MTLIQALAITNKVRLPHWRKHIYWALSENEFHLVGTEIHHGHITVANAISTEWEPFVGDDSPKVEPDTVIGVSPA